jgi:hypothetical protein
MTWSRFRDALKMIEVSVDGLEVIRDLTQVQPEHLGDAMRAVAATVNSLHDGFTGKTTPDVVREELRAIRERFPRTVDSKFDPGG